MHTPSSPGLFAYRPYWAVRFGIAPFLPMSRAEMEVLGWDACDVILVTGDAYVDHPSFGMAIIGRLLEAQGFRVGIISQPDWTSAAAFQVLGQPRLFFGVTSGNMDSMVNHYTAERRPRSNDAYTPHEQAGRRPDRAVLVYAQRCREAYRDTPVILGGIEASLRRAAHYDYWSDKVRRSILLDAKADLLLYGNAERAVVEVAHRLAKGEGIRQLRDIRGTAFVCKQVPEGWTLLDAQASPQGLSKALAQPLIQLPSYAQVKDDPLAYAHAARCLHLESNPGNARPLLQAHGDKFLWLNPPPLPLTTAEMDAVYALPFARAPHPQYGDARLPAWEMIRSSINILRGCFGGCSFCSITAHEGRIIQSRSEASILQEVEDIKAKVAGFTGVISDLGGPTANMYRLGCKDKSIEAQCRRSSCLHPQICSRLETRHTELKRLYQQVRSTPGIKRVLIASGVRYDLALQDPDYIKALVTHHVGGYLKIAPEHTQPGPLAVMQKPAIAHYEAFARLFYQYSQAAQKEQYLIPYFIAAHPGSTDEDMLALALWLKQHDYRLDQVQSFLPAPMALATTMYHTGLNPLKAITPGAEAAVFIPKGERQRRLHKALLRYHDPQNWPLLREALMRMGRTDLIGQSKRHLIPPEPRPHAHRNNRPHASRKKKR